MCKCICKTRKLFIYVLTLKWRRYGSQTNEHKGENRVNLKVNRTKENLMSDRTMRCREYPFILSCFTKSMLQKYISSTFYKTNKIVCLLKT